MRFNRLGLCIVLLPLLASRAMSAAGQRAIPEDNLAYPVLITVGNSGSGSGFFLDTADSVYLVTAKHVLFDRLTHSLISPHIDLLSYSTDPADPTQIRIAVDLAALQSRGMLKPHSTEDVVVVRLFAVVANASTTPAAPARSVPAQSPTASSNPQDHKRSGTFTITALPGVTVQSMASAGLLGVSSGAIKTFNQVLIGNEVILFGYPSSLALQQLQQLDPGRPLLRKGIIAGTNPTRKSIILDCPVYFGNSGGPVLEMDPEALGHRFSIIGVVDQYVPFVQNAGSQTFAMQIMSNSGYSIITPMDFVLELTK